MTEFPDDKTLTEAFKNQFTREDAFRLIIRKYQKRIYYAVRRIVDNHDDTNDIVQDVFIKVWEKFESFRGESSIYTWIHRVAINESLSCLKRKNRNLHFDIDNYPEENASVQEQELILSGDEIQEKFNKAVQELPEKQKLVFNLKYFENMKYEEMSALLGTTEGALKASYHHAVKKIEKFILGN
jgi:RNA polymerase sigma-70 factor (ECF subfamily)